MAHRKQHKVPKSYLKSWCDPKTAAGQEPYVHAISKDGSQMKRRAPHKLFIGNDAYTIHLPSGKRDLVVEHTLAWIESRFVSLREHKINGHYALDDNDRATLCTFIAAMSVRT